MFNPTFRDSSLKMTFGMALVFSVRGLSSLVLQNSMVFAVFIVLWFRCIVPLYE